MQVTCWLSELGDLGDKSFGGGYESWGVRCLKDKLLPSKMKLATLFYFWSKPEGEGGGSAYLLFRALGSISVST